MMNRIPNSAPMTTELPDGGWAQEIRRLENQGQTVVPYTQGAAMPGTAGTAHAFRPGEAVGAGCRGEGDDLWDLILRPVCPL